MSSYSTETTICPTPNGGLITGSPSSKEQKECSREEGNEGESTPTGVSTPTQEDQEGESVGVHSLTDGLNTLRVREGESNAKNSDGTEKSKIPKLVSLSAVLKKRKEDPLKAMIAKFERNRKSWPEEEEKRREKRPRCF